MDDELFAVDQIDEHRKLCISHLAAKTVEEGAAHNLGAVGYFIYEVDDRPTGGGIHILAKATSLEAAFRLLDIWRGRAIL